MTAPLPTFDEQARGADAPRSPRLVAWVDGVGAFLLCLGETATLGGLSGRADVRLAADLAARHAAVRRSGERYVVEATAPALVASGTVTPSGRRSLGRVVEGRTDLGDGEELLLYREGGGGVRLKFRQPNVLTATATLSVASEHRTDPRYDGVVLLAEACVLGPRPDAHVRCRHWEETLLLFRRDEGLWCKSPVPLSVDGAPAAGPFPVEPGSHVAGEGISFRLEAL